MLKKIKKRHVETSLIIVMAALLTFSLYSLCTKAVAVQSNADKFPDLYSERTPQTKLDPKTVYLTFDDGPSKNTEAILDLLAETGTKATFFVTAQQEDRDYLSKMLNRIIDEGHVLGLHSYSHNYSKIYAYPEAFLADINSLRKLIKEETGYSPSIYRFPGGSNTINAGRQTIVSIQNEMLQRGYIWYDWDITIEDSMGTVRAAEDICKTIVNGVVKNNGGIVLAHDSSEPKTTPEGVRLAIEKLSEMGYSFKALPCE